MSGRIKVVTLISVLLVMLFSFHITSLSAEKDEIWTYFSTDEYGSSFAASVDSGKSVYAVCYVPWVNDKAVAVTAVYSGDTLLSAKIAKDIFNGKNVIAAGSISASETMKLFLFETSSNIKPLCVPKSITTQKVDLSSMYFCEDFEGVSTGSLPSSLTIDKPDYFEVVTDPFDNGNRVIKMDTTVEAAGQNILLQKSFGKAPTEWVSLSFDMYSQELNSTALRTYLHDGDEYLIYSYIGKSTGGRVRIYDTLYDGDKYFESSQSTLDGKVHINMIHKLDEKKIDLYINGELSAENINMTSQTFNHKLNFVRIQLFKQSREKVYLDNIKVYLSKDIYVPQFILDAMPVGFAETEPISPNLDYFDAVKDYITASPTSYIEGYDVVKAKYSDSVCFVLGNNNVWLGKNRYSMDVSPKKENNILYVPANYLAASLGVDYSRNESISATSIGGIIIRDGERQLKINGEYRSMRSEVIVDGDTVYVPLKEVVASLGKYCFESVKGIAFVSDKNLALTDEFAISSDLYVPDYVHMMNYIIYERPNAQRIRELINQKNPDFQRPYIYSTPERLAALKQRLKTDVKLKSWSDAALNRAIKEAAKTDLPVQVFDSQTRFEGTPHINTILDLCWAHYLNGNDKYSARAIDLALAVADWESWSAKTHYISVCSPVDVCAAVLDFLYDDLTESQRTKLKNAIYNLAVKPGLDVYYGKLLPNYPPHMRNNNWNSSSNSAMVVGALAILDTVETENCYDAIEKAVMSLERMLHNFAPDGGWYESLGYWQATVTDVVQTIAALQYSTGCDFSLTKVPGFELTGMYPFYISGNAGGFAYHDSPRKTNVCPPQTLWFAELTNNPSLVTIYKNFMTANSYSSSPNDILYYYICNETSAPQLPLDIYIGGVEVASMRSDWTFGSSNVFAAIHAGYNSAIHGQFDMGTFEYSTFNTKFATDMGSDDYNLPGYWARTGIYVHRAEGHNVYVLDPDESAGQHEEAYSVIREISSSKTGAEYSIDMTSAYAHQGVTNAVRTFTLSNNRKVFTVCDEISSVKSHEAHWFWHTPAQTALGSDEKSVVLTSGGKSVTLHFESNVDFEIVLRQSTPLSTSPQNNSQLSNMTDLENLVEVIFDTDPEQTVFSCTAVPEGVAYTTNN